MSIPSKAALALLTLAAVGVQAQPVVTDGVVTDPAGRTLYVFDKDQTNQSNCADKCLTAWPAYTADAAPGAAVHSAATRLPSGNTQHWVWKGKPLYYFVGDAAPGQRAGDGSGGVWHIVKPAAKKVAAEPKTKGYGYSY
jgi:predicted lipoprotein with Yx(FWY)xxD motif